MEKVGEFELLTKKEVSILKAERDKLELNLGGVKDMRELPGCIFVVDPTKEHICVKEANKLGIPTVGLVDTNCDPSGIDYVIPGNDDAIRSVKLIASAIADAVIEAREGVSLSHETDDEVVDLKAALSEVKPTVEMAEEVEAPAQHKKAKAKKALAEEAPAEEVKEEAPATEEATEEAPAEEKPKRKPRAKKAETEVEGE